MTNQPIRVLLVDDDERFRCAAVKVLGREGFDVTAVGTGPEAVEAARRGAAQVVVLDWSMPSLDGKDVLTELRRMVPDLPVLILTRPGAPEAAVAALRQGVFDYLLKPCTMDLLARKIEAAYNANGGIKKSELKVRDIMTPLSSFSSIRENGTVSDAIIEIIEHFIHTPAGLPFHSTIHRSILVMGEDGNVVGIITFRDILQNLRQGFPGPDETTPEIAPGAFTVLARNLAQTPVREIMSAAPPVIPGDAPLIAAVARLMDHRLRRLLVVENDQVIGVLREQDLFFEAANVIRRYQTLR
jgi:DNA-binding response OmpR family regulator